MQFNETVISTVLLHARLAGAGKAPAKRGQVNSGNFHPLFVTALHSGKLVVSDGKTGEVLDEIASPIAPTLRLPAEIVATFVTCATSPTAPIHLAHDPSDGTIVLFLAQICC
jgi:hypothetical protein